ncbi:unnamed protein product [Danaus chrysippus]|uniref:(African queen) hypothetical protein n=1 Tax=Danaus chrysippus TaxID=151541 RepID=A0A8J2QMD3_9NEOP|nr:unnamed protein product [Danaus chrysippus]
MAYIFAAGRRTHTFVPEQKITIAFLTEKDGQMAEKRRKKRQPFCLAHLGRGEGIKIQIRLNPKPSSPRIKLSSLGDLASIQDYEIKSSSVRCWTDKKNNNNSAVPFVTKVTIGFTPSHLNSGSPTLGPFTINGWGPQDLLIQSN